MRCRCLAACLAFSPWCVSAVVADEPVAPIPTRILIRAGHLLDVRTGTEKADQTLIKLLQQVAFVMKAGVVYKHDMP